ncbi:protein TonB [Undibacterium sp. GrIS 1.8]|uniref:hypothetical protein n=1 Tax=unclassified Undibacterium TaxID=2630295 RepID=UPI0033987E43
MMKKSKLVMLVVFVLTGCATRSLEEPAPRGQTPDAGKAAAPKPVTAPSSSTAFTINGYKRDLAQYITKHNADKSYSEQPQALLRSVIVLKFILASDGKLIKSEIMRSNHDKVTEATALNSLRVSAPFPKPLPHLVRNGRLEIIETWLFNDDGRFQLRSIALPQIDE